MILLNTDELKFDENGLIPAIVVDAATKKVLTLAYMNTFNVVVYHKVACSEKNSLVFTAGRERNSGLKGKRAEIISTS